MNLLKLITELARKGGLSTEAESLTQLAENTALAEIELPSDVGTALNGLMGLEQAKTNPKVKSHFFAQALDGIDSQIITSAKEAGLSEDQIAQIESEKATGKRQQLLTQFLKDRKPAASEEATRKLKELGDQITKLQTEKEQAVNEVQSKWNAEREESALQSHFGQYPWADHYPAEVRGLLAKTTLEAKLSEAGAIKEYNPETRSFDLKNAKDKTLPFTGENGLPITFKEFSDKVMANNNYLKTDAGAGQSQDTEKKTYQGKTADTKAKSNPAISANDKALADMGVTTK